MHGLIAKTCIALTWDARHVCRGIKLVRRGDRVSVIAHWYSDASAKGEPSVALANGLRALGADANTAVLVGSDACDFGFADLVMPDLTRENLRNALRFQLNKHAPLSEDKLAWGFRVTGRADADHVRVRLAYMPETQWRRWLDIASGLAHSVDAIMPAAAALDPLFSDTALYIDTENGQGYLFAPSGTGREVLTANASNSAAFGSGDRPLEHDRLDVGPLVDLPAGQQAAYAGAVVLGMYGTTSQLRQDKRTWFRVPDELQPRRHRASRRAAAALAVYACAILGFGLARSYVDGTRYMNELAARQADLRHRITRLIESEDPEAFVSALGEEVTALDLNRPTLFECLLTLTEQIPHEYWVSNMSWTDGKIELQIRSELDDLAFLDNLRDSPHLTDIVPTRKSVDHQNNMTLQVQMRAARGFPLLTDATPHGHRDPEGME